MIKKYDEFVLESINNNEFNKILSKIKKDIGVNLYLVSTFGTGITAFYSLVENIVKNSKLVDLSSEQIILLTVCAISISLNESKDDIIKLKNVIYKEGLKTVLSKVEICLNNVFILFNKISLIVGKTVMNLIDMFAYTSLFVPFIILLSNFINTNNINFDTLNIIMNNPEGFAISAGIGLTTITIKHLINYFIQKLK